MERVHVRQLSYAKWLYERGRALAVPGGTQFDWMVAVHHFHNAVELTLRAIILKERIRPESELRNTNFEAMLNWVLEYGSDSNIDLPHRQHISSLTVRRNAIQHHGEEPSYSAVAESKASCESILTGAFIGFFGVDFSGFTPFHVLNNKFATELLSDAESSISKGNFSQAVAACKLLLGLALCSLSELTPDPFVFDEEHQSGAERERSTATITQHSLGRRISETGLSGSLRSWYYRLIGRRGAVIAVADRPPSSAEPGGRRACHVNATCAG